MAKSSKLAKNGGDAVCGTNAAPNAFLASGSGALNEAALRNNASLVEYCRTSACALSGSTAGVMGLASVQGFAFYFFTVFALWVLLLLKAGPNWRKYFVNRTHLLTNGFFGGLFTYVLFWTFLYGMVHVY